MFLEKLLVERNVLRVFQLKSFALLARPPSKLFMLDELVVVPVFAFVILRDGIVHGSLRSHHEIHYVRPINHEFSQLVKSSIEVRENYEIGGGGESQKHENGDDFRAVNKLSAKQPHVAEVGTKLLEVVTSNVKFSEFRGKKSCFT